MRKLGFFVPPGCHGMTVRDFSRQVLGLSSRTFIKQKHVANGMLKNGVLCRSNDILEAGDKVEFCLPEEKQEYEAFPGNLSILWETEDYLAVDKSSGMPIHPSPGHDRDSLLNAVAYYYGKTGQGLLFRPLYRLDKDTSGIVILGKHRPAVSSAVLQKSYYAICEGELQGCGTVDTPIGLSAGSKILRETGHGDSAVTHWRALASEGSHTLLELTLDTGRTHQIRVHLSSLGHPLAGDDLYGGSLEKIKRQALHCGVVSLICPLLHLEKTLYAPIPADILAAFPWCRAALK